MKLRKDQVIQIVLSIAIVLACIGYMYIHGFSFLVFTVGFINALVTVLLLFYKMK